MLGLEKVLKMCGKGLDKVWKFIFKTAEEPCLSDMTSFTPLLHLARLRMSSFLQPNPTNLTFYVLPLCLPWSPPFSLTLHLETQRLFWSIFFKTRLCHLTLLACDRFSTATIVSIQNNCELCQKGLLTFDALCPCSCLLSNVMFDQPCVQRFVSETCCCHKMQRQQDFVPFADRQCGSLYPSTRLYSPGLETIERFVLAQRQSQG